MRNPVLGDLRSLEKNGFLEGCALTNLPEQWWACS